MSDKKNKKLCKIKKKQMEKDFDEIASVIKPVNYICKKCCRAASDKKYLCKPECVD